jgi:hypothetical protein
MRKAYLGDSYDLVKRFWSESLRSIAPLHAHPRFVPTDIRSQYTAVTSIPLLDTDKLPKEPFGVLLDPHTGIPLPTEHAENATAVHAPLPFIVQTNDSLRAAYMICFDQSFHRRHDLSRARQRESKRAFLQERGINSFYYVSHASFLFMAARLDNLVAVRRRLESLGLPQDRFEPHDESAA